MLSSEDRDLLGDVFTGINLSESLITDVMSMLDESADEVHAARPGPLNALAYGQSDTGGRRLATNASLARQAIVDEMSALVAGLRGYRANIVAWKQDTLEVDTASADRMASLEAATECIVSPTVSGQCSLPTTGDDA